jgi:CheY-like chemotaxis protein
MGGTLSVSSTSGKGSSFTVYLPGIQVSAVAEPDSDHEKSPLSILFEGSKVLLVEDIPTNRKLIRAYLDQHNIALFEAENGSIGVQKARELNPDLILMDIQMPEMDGIEASTMLKSDEELKHIPVVALTASALKSDKDKINQLCDGYLHKPVSKGELLNELKRHLPHEQNESHEKTVEMETHTDQYTDPLENLKNRLSGLHNVPVEFKPLFCKGILPDYQELVKNRSNKRIRTFAQKMIETGVRLDLEELEAFGKDLNDQVDSFNINRISFLLNGFEELKEVIINES